jgi:hypothetical protein
MWACLGIAEWRRSLTCSRGTIQMRYAAAQAECPSPGMFKLERMNFGLGGPLVRRHAGRHEGSERIGIDLVGYDVGGEAAFEQARIDFRRITDQRDRGRQSRYRSHHSAIKRS